MTTDKLLSALKSHLGEMESKAIDRWNDSENDSDQGYLLAIEEMHRLMETLVAFTKEPDTRIQG